MKDIARLQYDQSDKQASDNGHDQLCPNHDVPEFIPSDYRFTKTVEKPSNYFDFSVSVKPYIST